MAPRPRGPGAAGMALALLAALFLAACAQGPLPTPAPPPGPTATLAPRYYTVAPGDTISAIAAALGIDEQTLILVNEIENPDLIQPGQRLLISERVTISGRVLPTATPTPLPCLQGCRQPFPGCEIKGIVARLDGEQLYLLPEDELYALREADMWFCRAGDAERSGWRRWTVYGPATPAP